MAMLRLQLMQLNPDTKVSLVQLNPDTKVSFENISPNDKYFTPSKITVKFEHIFDYSFYLQSKNHLTIAFILTIAEFNVAHYLSLITNNVLGIKIRRRLRHQCRRCIESDWSGESSYP